MHRIDWQPDDDRPAEPLQSDALIVRMLKAIERDIARLERAPTRRRQSPERQLAQARAINALIRRFQWLMLRYQAILDRPPPERSWEDEERALQALENRIGELVAECRGRRA